MAKSANSPAAPVSPNSSHRRWRRVVAVVIALTVVLGITGAVVAWNVFRQPQRLASALPLPPDFAGCAPELAHRIREAGNLVAGRTTALDGVAELGRLYHANGFAQEAEACWRLLGEEQPQEGRWCYYLAELRRGANDYEGMIALLERTTGLAPAYAPAWLRLADMRFKSGRMDEAVHAYRRRLELLPDDPYGRLGLARVALQQGRHAEARNEIEQLVRDAPGFSPGHNVYAQMLAMEGNETAAARERALGTESRFREAPDPWLDVLIDDCYDYERLCVQGTIDVQTGRSELGRALFQRAIAIRPVELTAYELLGNSWLDVQDGAKARDVYEQGLSSAPEPGPSADFFASLSRAYGFLDQPAEAARLARDGLRERGASSSLYDALGDALGALGEPEAAVEALRSAVALRPADANAHYKLAVALLSVRRLEEAMEALRHSHAARPTFPPTLALLAQIEMDSGHWPEALRYLQPLYNANPELPEAREKMTSFYLRAGMSAEQSGDFVAAEQHFRAGLAITPDRAEIQARLGAFYVAQRRFNEAISPLEIYSRLQPGDPQGMLLLGEVLLTVGRRSEARTLLEKAAKLAEGTGRSETAQRCRSLLANQ